MTHVKFSHMCSLCVFSGYVILKLLFFLASHMSGATHHCLHVLFTEVCWGSAGDLWMKIGAVPPHTRWD